MHYFHVVFLFQITFQFLNTRDKFVVYLFVDEFCHSFISLYLYHPSVHSFNFFFSFSFTHTHSSKLKISSHHFYCSIAIRETMFSFSLFCIPATECCEQTNIYTVSNHLYIFVESLQLHCIVTWIMWIVSFASYLQNKTLDFVIT